MPYSSISALRRAALMTSASFGLTVGVLLLASDRALAINECGVPANNAVTCVGAAGDFPNGIFYQLTGDLTVNLAGAVSSPVVGPGLFVQLDDGNIDIIRFGNSANSFAGGGGNNGIGLSTTGGGDISVLGGIGGAISSDTAAALEASAVSGGDINIFLLTGDNVTSGDSGVLLETDTGSITFVTNGNTTAAGNGFAILGTSTISGSVSLTNNGTATSTNTPASSQ